MRTVKFIGSVVPTTDPQTHPKTGVGSVSGARQTVFDLDGMKTISSHIDDLYAALQLGVETFGGTVALAASMEKPVPGVSLRVRHERDSKGDVQNATLDMLGHIKSDHKAWMVVLNKLLDEAGCKPAERKAEPTTEEKYRALIAVLRGELGESVLEKAAEVGGFDAGSFRR